MTKVITFVPHPRLDYTERYNHLKENYQNYITTEQKEKEEQERLRLLQFQEEQRILKNRLFVKEMQEANLYTVMNKQKDVNDYKYSYYVGTLVDIYV